MATATLHSFEDRKAKGIEAEVQFMERIALMGGTAQPLGHLPGQEDSAPRFYRPHGLSEEGYTQSVSPDVVCTLPHLPRGMAFLAQVKIKKVQRDSGGKPYVYLDEKELHRMRVAARSSQVLFIANIPNDEYSDQWLWLNVDSLNQDRITLRNRTVRGTKTLLVPLSCFRPISELTKVSFHVPANTNAAPTAA